MMTGVRNFTIFLSYSLISFIEIFWILLFYIFIIIISKGFLKLLMIKINGKRQCFDHTSVIIK